MVLPPKWLIAYKKMVTAVLHAEVLLIRVMVHACRLGIRERKWLEFQDPMCMDEKILTWEQSQRPCTHQNQKRYGNKHGRYSQCHDCGKKWQWDDNTQAWVEPRRSQKQQQPLPLPSSPTAVVFQDRRYKPAWGNITNLAAAATSSWNPSAPASPPPPIPIQHRRLPKRGVPVIEVEDQEVPMEEDYEWEAIEG